MPEEVGSEIALYQHVLREHGLRLLGPAPSDLIGRVPGTALRAGCRWVVDRWVTGWLREPEQLEPVDFRSFAALTCCRLLYTLMTGGVASKPVAAKWAASVQDEGLARVALAALAVSETEMGDPLTIEDTQALIWRTLHSFGISRP